VSAICRPPSKINQLLINMHRYCEGFSYAREKWVHKKMSGHALGVSN
jgi:hypothetical protein